MGIDVTIIGELPKGGLLKKKATLEDFVNAILKYSVPLQVEVATGPDFEGVEHTLISYEPDIGTMEIYDRGNRIVEVGARTSGTGPGYHIFICDAVRNAGKKIGMKWLPEPSEEEFENSEDPLGTYDETGYFFSNQVEDVMQAFETWMRSLANLLSEYDESEFSVLRSVGESFKGDLPITTPMGWRGPEWIEAVKTNARAGFDILMWPEPGLNAEFYKRLALYHMWNNVRWRKPLTQAESDLNDVVLNAIERAHELDAEIALPTREYTKLAYLQGRMPVVQQKFTNDIDRGGLKLIGYRHGEVTRSLPAGWSVVFPEDFAEGDEEGCLMTGNEDLQLRFSLQKTGESLEMNVASAKEIAAESDTPLDDVRFAKDYCQGFAGWNANDDESHTLVGFCAAADLIAVVEVHSRNESLREAAEKIFHSIDCTKPDDQD